jgi:hypothetical protein
MSTSPQSALAERNAFRSIIRAPIALGYWAMPLRLAGPPLDLELWNFRWLSASSRYCTCNLVGLIKLSLYYTYTQSLRTLKEPFAYIGYEKDSSRECRY